jgi:hypothetical protein
MDSVHHLSPHYTNIYTRYYTEVLFSCRLQITLVRTAYKPRFLTLSPLLRVDPLLENRFYRPLLGNGCLFWLSSENTIYKKFYIWSKYRPDSLLQHLTYPRGVIERVAIPSAILRGMICAPPCSWFPSFQLDWRMHCYIHPRSLLAQ